MATTMRQRMAEEGLTSYIVSYIGLPPDEIEGEYEDLVADAEAMQFWAEDEGHAGSQFDDSEPDSTVLLIESQDEYEDRTGKILDYGRGPAY